MACLWDSFVSKMIMYNRIMKTCARCSEIKVNSDFNKAKANKDGLSSYCRPCGKEASREYRTTNKVTIAKKDREKHLLRKYNLTTEDYEDLLKLQNGMCANLDCLISIDLVVDHCHYTGTVRGILCSKCNVAIGLAANDPDILRGLANYLER